MNLLITGGREFTDLPMVFDAIAKLNESIPIDYLVHGDAKGADKLADKVAKSLGISRIIFPANWDKFYKAAGAIRNRSMITMVSIDLVLAFPGGTGTADMKKQAETNGIAVIDAIDLLEI